MVELDDIGAIESPRPVVPLDKVVRIVVCQNFVPIAWVFLAPLEGRLEGVVNELCSTYGLSGIGITLLKVQWANLPSLPNLSGNDGGGRLQGLLVLKLSPIFVGSPDGLHEISSGATEP